MKVIESSIENYTSNLKSLIDELQPTYVLGGWAAIKELKDNNILQDNKLQHSIHFDSRELFFGLHPVTKMVPLSSYNCILFSGFKIIGQIYLDEKLAWEQYKEKIKVSNVSN